MPLAQPCPSLRCPNIKGQCKQHDSQPAYRDTKTDSERKFYSSYRWTQASLRWRKANPLCEECRRQGKVVKATVTDHKVAIRDGGDAWDTRNFQSLCQPCHDAKRRQERYAREGKAMTKVTVVYGLSGAGKTTYVRERMAHGKDIVVDLDAICSAISGLDVHDNPPQFLPFTASARDAIYERLTRPSQIQHAWVITTDANAAQQLKQRFGADLIELSVDEATRTTRLSERKTNKSFVIR